ncbi:hypothetical protein NDN08_007202 [Rhodosorus marinus]|uniref:protein-histidine N-methyltransferase n=1 Tax=Rhodosorus marinus TaxID=101924 RepID=A0AAV8UFW6_9RHOD|nr:hypothetical protein NDN08_007202 [Rhodosorus marinus]
MGGRDRVRVKRVSELVSSLEAVALTEAKWERDRVGALRDLVRAEEELMRAQGGVGMGVSGSFGDRWEVFEEWVNKFGVDTTAFRAEVCGGQGVGLVAERDIREGEKLIYVPRQLMITADIALKNADMAHLFQTDILLRRIESLALSMCVLRERLLGSQSKFAPYLDIIPQEFSTPLWFSPDEVVALKGSPVLDKVTNRVRGHARQYCHLYNVVKSGAVPSIPPTQFTFELFRWAVSVVMTRQNMVPTSTGGESLALIPLWDMINHSQGEYTTQYDLARDQVEFFAMTNTPRDKQILMFYGPRPNSELLLHAGFVHRENLHDALEVRIEVDTKEPLARVKLLLLEKQGVALVKSYGENGPVQVVGSVDVNGQLSKELVALGRVVSMDKADVEAALRDGSSLFEKERPGCLREEVEAESRVWLKEVLEQRLAEYEGAVSGEEENDAGQTQFYAMARSLCRLEVVMIRKAIDDLSS